MNGVIYADVLVVLNIYVTYALLSLTGIICRKKRSPMRIFLACVLAGFYSLTILIPDANEVLMTVTRLPVALLLCFIAFGFVNKRVFLRLSLCFFAVSFGFAGVMLFLWLFFSPQGMYYNNGIVYFDIDTATLVLLTIFCYAVLSLCHRYIKSKTPANTVYDCEIFFRDKKYFCHCFLDTGNSLTDPYTGNPVVIVSRDKFKNLLPENIFDISDGDGQGFRLIPCSGVAGKKLLLSFRSEKIHVKGLEKDFSCGNVTIAVTDDKIHGGSFDGILPPEIFHNQTDEKGADFDNENQRLIFKA
ncbi:MAG: sigma-E processing peptidase SpoIIGA [Clostridia bacterium]|nr:sigma-E processing peptidase SpoIIGA [Clostridia bacterium]